MNKQPGIAAQIIRRAVRWWSSCWWGWLAGAVEPPLLNAHVSAWCGWGAFAKTVFFVETSAHPHATQDDMPYHRVLASGEHGQITLPCRD